eukprot:2036605-Rhodomonas_salina.2
MEAETADHRLSAAFNLPSSPGLPLALPSNNTGSARLVAASSLITHTHTACKAARPVATLSAGHGSGEGRNACQAHTVRLRGCCEAWAVAECSEPGSRGSEAPCHPRSSDGDDRDRDQGWVAAAAELLELTEADA